MEASDNAIDSLMGELWEQQGYAGSKVESNLSSNSCDKVTAAVYERRLKELDGYPNNHHAAGNHSIWNAQVSAPSNIATLGDERDSLRCRLPTNPQVEVVRRRAFEKFKQDSREIIERVSSSWGLKLPVPAIIEKWHMDAKLAEAQESLHTGTMALTSTLPLISSTENVYHLLSNGASKKTIDPIMLGKKAVDLFQATLEPEVKKAWVIKQNHASQSQPKKQQQQTLPPKSGKKFQHIRRSLIKIICDTDDMFQKQMLQAVKHECQQIQLQQGQKKRKLPKIVLDSEKEQYMVTYAGISLRIHSAYYDKLQRLYDRAHIGGASVDEGSFEESVFALLCRYDTLQGAGLQAAVPGRVLDTLLRHFGCRMECFASPLNSRYERFASAFDLDKNFGSLGSFFDLKDDFFTDGGCFEANPPFCDGAMNSLNDRIRRLLQHTSKALMFVVFVPAWKDSKAYSEGLLKNGFLEKHFLLPSGKHWYAEGTQHRRKASFRPASFDTSVLFYQNAAARDKWPVGASLIQDLKGAFCENPGSMDKVSLPSSSTKNWRKRPINNKINKSARKSSTSTALKDSKKRNKPRPLDKKRKLIDSQDEGSAQLDLLHSLGLAGGVESVANADNTKTFSKQKNYKKKKKATT